jgi:hypothetical protein
MQSKTDLHSLAQGAEVTKIDDNKAKYAAKIAALLKKAESTPHTGEADLLREAAFKLSAKWGVDDAMAAAAAEAAGGPREKIEKRTIRFTDQFARGWSFLWNNVAIGMGGLKVVETGLRNPKTGRLNGQMDLHVIGHESDVDRFITMVTSLRLQAQREEMRYWAKHRYDYYPTVDGGSRQLTQSEGFRQRREFIIGFGDGVREKLEAQRVEATEETTGSALVLVDRAQLVAREVPTYFKVLVEEPDWLSHGTGDANSAGNQAGWKADLGNKRMDGKRSLPAA